MASVKIIGFDKALTKFANIKSMPTPSQLDRMKNIGVAGIQSNFEGNPLNWAPNKPSTIAAKGSSHPNVDRGHMKLATFGRLNAQIIELVNNDFKAIFAEEGTKEHTIESKKKKADGTPVKLKFKGEGGKDVFRTSVRHPGTPPRKFMYLRKEIVQQMLDVLKEGLQGKL